MSVALLACKYLGRVWLDPVLGIVVAVAIVRWAWSLMRDAAGVLLGRTDGPVAEEIRELVGQVQELQITDLHVQRLGPEARTAIIRAQGAAIISAENVREILKSVHEVGHMTVDR